MLKEPYISINHSQLLDFRFLCKTIRDNSIDMLAVTFAAIVQLKEKVDEPDAVYSLNEDIDETLRKTKDEMEVPVPGYLNSTPCFLWNWVKEVKENLDDYIFVYNMFTDNWSKQTFHRIILSRFLLDVTYINPTYKPIEYFNRNILSKKESTVLVDCGAFIGDTILSYVKVYGSDYQKIYAYEPEPYLFEVMKRETASLHDIVYRNCGVGEIESTMRYNSEKGIANHIVMDDTQPSNMDIPIVSLDKDIEEPVSFIKMDIEGFEINALKGAEHHIVNDKPQMAICVYHLMEDLRVIPLLIYKYNKNQKFFIRNHLRGYTYAEASEVVFYAEPCSEAL